MTSYQLFAVLVEGLFAVVFAASLLAFVQRRDPVSRDIALTFSPFVGLLVLTFWRSVFGPPPAVLSGFLGVLFFAQPVFALHLVSLIRPVPRQVLVGAALVLAASLIPVVVVRPIAPLLALLPLAVFSGIQLLTAAYLAAAARGRRGPGGLRLGIAAAATVGLAVALLLTSGRALGSGVGEVIGGLALGLALLAGIGYVVAFLPPTTLRRVWQAGATVDYQGDLLGRAGSSVDAIWDGYAKLAAEMTGAACAVLEHREPGEVAVIAAAGFDALDPHLDSASSPTEGPAKPIRVDVTVDTLAPDDPIRSVAASAGAGFASVAAVGQAGSQRAHAGGRVAVPQPVP